MINEALVGNSADKRSGVTIDTGPEYRVLSVRERTRESAEAARKQFREKMQESLGLTANQEQLRKQLIAKTKLSDFNGYDYQKLMVSLWLEKRYDAATVARTLVEMDYGHLVRKYYPHLH